MCLMSTLYTEDFFCLGSYSLLLLSHDYVVRHSVHNLNKETDFKVLSMVIFFHSQLYSIMNLLIKFG